MNIPIRQNMGDGDDARPSGGWYVVVTHTNPPVEAFFPFRFGAAFEHEAMAQAEDYAARVRNRGTPCRVIRRSAEENHVPRPQA